jgi:hypothetical protein
MFFLRNHLTITKVIVMPAWIECAHPALAGNIPVVPTLRVAGIQFA